MKNKKEYNEILNSEQIIESLKEKEKEILSKMEKKR